MNLSSSALSASYFAPKFTSVNPDDTFAVANLCITDEIEKRLRRNRVVFSEFGRSEALSAAPSTISVS
jgi:hypothetical protein